MITILETKRHHNVLILDKAFDLEQSIDFQTTMFDAIYIMNDKVDEVEAILNDINPVTSNKCSYKPLIVSKALEGKMGLYDSLIDGYTHDIDDPRILDIIDSIYVNKQTYNVHDEVDLIANTNMFFVRVYRYLISRNQLMLTPQLGEMTSTGYTLPIFELFHSLERFHLHEHFTFEQIMFERGYFRIRGFVNKIHLCPKCQHSHLLYVESCPRCGSSQVNSEEVIHHFRCANITPEHTYNKGGQLVCPKCSKQLRHIGVDYDRPATVFSCKQCDNSFLHPTTKAICTNCHSEHEVAKLIPHDVNIFEITKEGIAEMVSNDIGFAVYTDFYDNYLEYARFVNRVRLLIEQKNMGEGIEDMVVGKVWILDDKQQTVSLKGNIVGAFCKIFTNHKVSVANNIVYINNVVLQSMSDYMADSFRVELSEALRRVVRMLDPGQRLCYTCALLEGEEGQINRFIQNLNYVAATPDDYCDYDEYMQQQQEMASENTEQVEDVIVENLMENDEETGEREENSIYEEDKSFRWLRLAFKVGIGLLILTLLALAYVYWNSRYV